MEQIALRGRKGKLVGVAACAAFLAGCGGEVTEEGVDESVAGLEALIDPADDEPPAGAPQAAFSNPLPGLNAAELERFRLGKEEFEEAETPEEGLGPVFNDVSCAACHTAGGIGGGSERTVTRFGVQDRNRFDPLPHLGGSLIQAKSIGKWGACNYLPEAVPPQANRVALRRTTPLFGLGLVDAVPDAAFHRLAQLQPLALRGRVSVVTNIETNRPAVGKLGWKGQVPNLHVFAADAYLNEMGITSPLFPNENCPQGNCALLSCNPVPQMNDAGDGVDAFRDFMMLLAPPPRGPITEQTRAGRRVFRQLGCATCHVPTLVTGRHPVAALNRKVFHPFSDFLLHDMGSLGDGIEQNSATSGLMRTAPLWGLRVLPRLLHDGRAATIEQAIGAHDGQAAAARDGFARLSQTDRAAILAFLHSL